MSARRFRHALLAALTAALALAVPSPHSTTVAQEGFSRQISVPPSNQPFQKSVNLGINKSIVIDLPDDAGDILVSDPRVADAILRTSRRLYVMGIEFGQANIFIFDQNGREMASIDLHVEIDLNGLRAMLKRVIPDSDIQVEAVNGSVVLTGEVRTSIDSQKAESIAFQMLARIEETVVGASGATATNIGDARTGDVLNLLRVRSDEQVALKVTIAEVQREVIKQLGINLMPSGPSWLVFNENTFGASLTNTNGPAFGAFSATANFVTNQFSVESWLQALEQTNVMRTLAEPMLTAVSGETAEFLAGGEYPVTRTLDSTIDDTGRIVRALETEWRPLGVSLAFTPVVLSGGRISLKLATEISEMTNVGGSGSQGGDGYLNVTYPPVTTRRASTTVEVPSGGAFVIAGLVREEMRKAINGTPGLSKLPILGALFSSSDFVRAETELVIIVTPYLVRPTSPDKIARPTDNFAVTNDAETIFLGRVNKLYGSGREPGGDYQGRYGFAFD